MTFVDMPDMSPSAIEPEPAAESDFIDPLLLSDDIVPEAEPLVEPEAIEPPLSEDIELVPIEVCIV